MGWSRRARQPGARGALLRAAARGARDAGGALRPAAVRAARRAVSREQRTPPVACYDMLANPSNTTLCTPFRATETRHELVTVVPPPTPTCRARAGASAYWPHAPHGAAPVPRG